MRVRASEEQNDIDGDNQWYDSHKNTLPRKPHRQICSVCHREYAIDFHVPNDIWELATHRIQRNSLICLDCFTRMADTRFVHWDKEIDFYPTSLVSHIEKLPEVLS